MAHDGDFSVHFKWIVRTNLAPETVFQRRDDAAAVGVILGVRRGDEHDVERQAHLVTADLDITLFEHVEQSDLNSFSKVWQLIDGEDPAIRARDETVMKRQFVGQVTTLCHFDGVDFADEVRDRRVGGRQLLAETL